MSVLFSLLQVPIVHPEVSNVNITLAKPTQNCLNISSEEAEQKIPFVKCREDSEEFCFEAIKMEVGIQEVNQCHIEFKKDDTSFRKCKEVKFQVPKTLCKDRPKPFR